MSPSIYLIAAGHDRPSVLGGEMFAHWGLPPTIWIADIALTTIAALVPSDFTVRICDESISPVDFDTPADFVGITGKVTQRMRMVELGEAFRRRGKTVLIGGPFASLSPESVRGAADILVRGEIEEIAADLFDDLRRGRWKDEYCGTRPDLGLSPIPRWDLYPNERSVTGAVQTSRGCPFDCEFCDVIQYLGRKQRHKPVARILEELDILYGHGYRSIFLSDDNFTVYRRRAKEVLEALYHWNRRPDTEAVSFSTQASIDAAKDEELLRMCGAAGLNTAFVGIETPNEASLRETNKRQNLLAEPVEQVERFLSHGIGVWSGMMVGFDADGPDIFERQFEFAMASPIPIFTLGAVVAPEATPLHARMKAEGRLLEDGNETASVPWETNIVPVGMTREQMSIGMRWLANRLFHPEFFGDRMIRFIDRFTPPRNDDEALAVPSSARRDLYRDVRVVVERFLQSEPALRKMTARVTQAVWSKPSTRRRVQSLLQQYAQIRCVYDQEGYWDPELGALDAPPF